MDKLLKKSPGVAEHEREDLHRLSQSHLVGQDPAGERGLVRGGGQRPLFREDAGEPVVVQLLTGTRRLELRPEFVDFVLAFVATCGKVSSDVITYFGH